MTRRWLLTFFLVLGLLPSQAAFAGGGGEKAFMIGVVAIGAVALFTFLVGLAFHGMLLGFAPGRGRALVSAASGKHRWKTFVLGAVNTFALVVIYHWAEGKAQPLAVLVLVTWFVTTLVGSHGIARGLGLKVLGIPEDEAPGPPGDVKVLALGWFVFVFMCAIPLLGYAALFYWSLRGTGVVAYTLLAPETELDPPIVSVTPRQPEP